ncbi:MAG: carboxypeptidase regulatory-like domain-containing protein [Bryobacteraceae bacterium]
MRQQLCLAALLAVLIALAAPAPAQNIFGTMLGTVTDASRAAVANAEVVATSTDTNQPTRTVTNDAGYYEFPYLKPGPYSVRVTSPGFKAAQRARVELRVDDRIRLDFQLEVGDISTSIAVEDRVPPVQSESASLGQVVTERNVQEMPLAGRNVFEIASLVAGVIVNPTAEGRFIAEGGFDSSDISISGGRYRTNEYLIDGVTVMLPQNNNHAITPTPEATQELKVMTGNSGAQFGRTGGGTINVVTRGGTNEFHGNAWEYFRNELFQANDFFANSRGQERGVFKFQMFGGTLGGPMRRNRTFFFAEYQASRDHVAGGSGVMTFPTEQQRRGDFSATRVANGNLITIYDPMTTRSAGTGFTRSPFPGNRIPQERIDPVSAKVLQYIPLPNRPGEGPAQLRNWGYTNQSDVNSDQGSMRIDHRFSDRHSIFGRFTRNVARFDNPAILGTIADSGGDNQVQAYINGVINGTYVLSPTRLVNYRLGVTRKIQDSFPTYFGKIKLNDLGFPSYVSASAQMELFPQMSFSGYESIGTGPPRRVSNDIYAWVADYTDIRGRHTLKFGADIRMYNQNTYNASAPSGIYSFSNSFTQGPDPLRASMGSGDGFASFLTGYGTGSIQYMPAFAIRNGYFGVYASDDIRLGRLTVNLGLRWDYEQPRTERYNRFANFDFTREFPVQVPGMAGLRGVLTQAGRENYPRGQFNTSKRNFAPHIGLAYRLRASTAVRAGYGIVYSPRIGYPNARNFGASGEEITTQWVSSLDGVTPLYPLSNPYPTGIFVRSSREADKRLLGQGITITDRNSKNNTYMQQWSFSLQQGLRGNWMLEAAYAGSRGIRLPIAAQFNQLDPKYQSLKADLNKQVANPFYGLVTTGTLAARTVTQGQLLRPYPQYIGISTYIQNAAYSIYHGLDLTAEKRFSHGYTFNLAYSASKTIDNGAGRILNITGLQPPIQNQYDLRAEKSLSQQDVSQRLALSHSVDLPFGRRKALLGGASGVLDALVGGWVASGQAVFQTGYPLWLSSIGNSGVFSAVQRPNNIGKSAELSGDVHSRMDRFFDTSVFTVPDTFTFGNTGRALPDTRGPSRRNYNLSISKKLRVTERFSAVLRGEAYNLTNTPYFSFPGTKLGNNDFGVISSSSGNRQLQLSAKVQF